MVARRIIDRRGEERKRERGKKRERLGEIRVRLSDDIHEEKIN